jgi:hypothetical protein
VSTKRQMRPREVRRWRGVCVAFMGKERGIVSLMLLGGFQCLRTGFVSTKKQMRPREVRRWFYLFCLQGERRGSCFVDVTGRSPLSSDWVLEHKETNATKGGCLWPGVCVASRA